MSLEKEVLKKIQKLSPDQQKEVLDFADFLTKKNEPASSPKKDEPASTGKSLRGLWADLKFQITPEDIAEARKEMWGKFPREMP